MWIMSPRRFDVVTRAQARAEASGHQMRTGYVTTATLIEVMETLLDKRGGYLQNDVMPPWVLLDNMPSWEIGVIFQARDLARTMRNDFSRSQTQSSEDSDLAIADPQFSFGLRIMAFAVNRGGSTRKGIEALSGYLDRLGQPGPDRCTLL